MALAPREYPQALAYLLDWLGDLHGRSGVTQAGLAPLSYPTIIAWSAAAGVRPTMEEIRALMQLDGVMLNPTGKDS